MGRNSIHSAVDIVVPIYNGYEDLLLCIDSLRRNTDLSRHRVLLIDDCSPDKRVRDVLSQVCAGRDVHAEHGMIALFNEKNLGFSANVNKGLFWSDRDTILLNSDTIVTAGWVEKLQSCAHRSKRIATVTPLSNAATLASVPVFLKDNPLPEGYTPDSYAELVERVSLHRYPRVCVGVGFCMYVCQEAFLQAGAFDEKTFGRGYGEENDFCFRCSMLGFTHVLCDDTFIYHKGTASFQTEEKRRLIEEHEKILRKRYPHFMEANDAYCRENPDSEIRDNLLLHQCLDNGKRNLLYFLHLDFRQIAHHSIGGTQLHVRDLVAGAKKDANVFVCSRDKDALRLTIYLEDKGLPEWELLQEEESADAGSKLISLKFPIGSEEPFPVYYDEHLEQVLTSILSSFSIDLVHVHHTQGLSLDIFHVCRKLEIPVLATLHDYYYACPTTKLLQPSGEFCPMTDRFLNPTDAGCAKCLRKNCGYAKVKVIKKWREENERALLCCQKLIFPSESAKRIMCEVFPSLEARSVVIPHGIDRVSSGTVRVRTPDRVQRTDRMHSRLDQMPGDGGSFHYISGWAYLEGVRSAETSILIEVTGPDGKVFCMEVRKHARPDVVTATAQPDYLWSGIHAVFRVPGLKEGRIRIRLLIREGENVWTDGRIYRTVWKQEKSDGSILQVAYLGGVTPAKGSGVLKELMTSNDSSFRLYVYGEVGDPAIRSVKTPDNVCFSGVYQKDDIYDLLEASRIDVALILPLWAETFCYTLSEAWACSIPVIGTDLGAVGERIRASSGGWLLRAGASGAEVRDLLAHIRKHPEELEEKKKNVRATAGRSVAQMNDAYRALYDACMVPPMPVVVTRRRDQDPDFLLEGFAMANPLVKGSGQAAQMNRLREENEMLAGSLEMLKSTTSYRVARKLSEANIPFKEPLKKLLKSAR